PLHWPEASPFASAAKYQGRASSECDRRQSEPGEGSRNPPDIRSSRPGSGAPRQARRRIAPDAFVASHRADERRLADEWRRDTGVARPVVPGEGVSSPFEPDHARGRGGGASASGRRPGPSGRAESIEMTPPVAGELPRRAAASP